jgi:deoxycytidylate deaminase
MYCPWFCCTDCALAIAQSGIKCVVGHGHFYEAADKTWEEKTKNGINILKEANVEMRWFGGIISYAKPVLVAGKLFCPKGETTNVAS